MEIEALKKQSRKQPVIYESEKAVRSLLLEFALFLFFLIVGTIVALSARHLFMFYFNQTVRNLFIKQDEEDISNYAKIATTVDWWEYLEKPFLDALHGRTKEGGNTENAANSDKRMLLNENILLGAPRLRQIRVLPNTCEVHESFSKYFDTCYAEYARSIEDMRDEWKGTSFFTLEELNAVSIWGSVGAYVGGGFVRDLTFDYNKNKDILKKLKDDQWIDRGTRLVVVEFCLYNGNTDLFNNVKFIAEIPPIGGVIPSARTQALQLHGIWTGGDYVVIVCAAMFYIMLIYYTIEEILEARQDGIRAYLRSKWNYLDLIIITLAYVTFIYNIWHPIYLSKILNRMNRSPDTYNSLDEICFWNWIYLNIWAMCAFSMWIKIFKFISFNKTMLQFSMTLRRCATDLLGFGLMFGIVFLAYAALGLLLFGTEHEDFRDFPESVLTMMRMLLGDFEYRTLEATNRVLGPIFFLSYILLVFFILLNMFLAIINDTYSGVKGEIQHGQNYLQNYICKKLRQAFGKVFAYCRKRRRNIQTDNKNITDPGPDASEGTEPPGGSAEPVRMSQTKYYDVLPSPSSQDFQEQLRVYQKPQERTEQVERLSNRLNTVEKMMEELVKSMDSILKKLDDKKKRKWN